MREGSREDGKRIVGVDDADGNHCYSEELLIALCRSTRVTDKKRRIDSGGVLRFKKA